MKRIYIYIFAASLLLTACGGGNQANQQDAADTTAASIPGIEKEPLTDSIKLQATDDMRFDKELFKVKSGKKIVLRLKNMGSQKGMPMSHNVVILSKGTDIATFADEARKFKAEQYIPPALASSIIAHTKQVSSGKSDEITFTIAQPGVYDFICSYPGHWGTMQGKIVAE
jgi:azurin